MARPLRHRPSSVDKLDPDIKRLISYLRLEHGWSIDQIKQRLDELMQPISRSALARHTKSLEEIGRDLRHTREMAKALAEARGLEDDGQISDLNQELLHNLLFRVITAENEGEMVMFAPKEVQALTAAAANIAQARKNDAERRRKDRDEAKAEGKLEAAEAALKFGQAAGLSKATVDKIYNAVLGVQ